MQTSLPSTERAQTVKHHSTQPVTTLRCASLPHAPLLAGPDPNWLLRGARDDVLQRLIAAHEVVLLQPLNGPGAQQKTGADQDTGQGFTTPLKAHISKSAANLARGTPLLHQTVQTRGGIIGLCEVMSS